MYDRYMNSKADFVKKLNDWISLNDLINQKQEELKKIKTEKENHEQNLIDFIEKNQLKKNKFTMRGESIHYSEVFNPPSISIKLIIEALEKYVSKEQLGKIISLIKQKREQLKKVNKVIKNKKIKPRKKSIRKPKFKQ